MPQNDGKLHKVHYCHFRTVGQVKGRYTLLPRGGATVCYIPFDQPEGEPAHYKIGVAITPTNFNFSKAEGRKWSHHFAMMSGTFEEGLLNMDDLGKLATRLVTKRLRELHHKKRILALTYRVRNRTTKHSS